MVKLIVGLKGTGKTKTLIDMVNEAAASSAGSVICLEQGDKLRYDINYQVRLVDTSAYGISGADALGGFVCGMYASNHDITHIFIDSAIKMCGKDIDQFASFFRSAADFAEKNGIDLVVTSSITTDDVAEDLKKYL
ncbi:MAG: hypothetical protein MJ101_02375 [Clostridia bacterium]|nr:hypothetical protein [Clostridia bacterium]